MESMKKYLKTEKGKTLAGAVVLALLPVFYALLRCLMDGKGISDLYLPASTWNDELFYYKLTENVVNYGYPQGYFGFNESHGLCLSFAAWSPLLLLSWVIWGLIFGWNLLSPILCNMAFLAIALFLFGMWTRPTWKQILAMACLYGAFTPITRFTLSCIPEAELFALLILFLGLALSCEKKYRGKKVAGMFVLVMLMTWMRPYLILLFLTPYVLWKKQRTLRSGDSPEKPKVSETEKSNEKQNVSKCHVGLTEYVTLLLGSLTVAVYWAVNHFFSAPYLTDLFYTDWIKTYFAEGLLAGIKYTLWKLADSLRTVFRLIGDNLFSQGQQDSAAGCYYLIFLMLFLIVLLKVVIGLKQSRKQETGGSILPEVQMLLCMAGFFVADLLMYRIQEGGRHTLVYIVGCLFLIPFWREKERYPISGILCILFLVILVGRADVPYEFALPYRTEEHAADLARLETQLEKEMRLTADTPNYDNTVIWTVWDSVDGQTRTVDFGAYYAVPTGFGINLCDGGYMDANLEHLQSRYIGTIPGGAFEKRCMEAGGKRIGACDRLVVYDMRPE